MILRYLFVPIIVLTVVFIGCQESKRPEITMTNQPISSYWFPNELLEWDAETDADLPYNISTVPLAERIEESKLSPVNDTQNIDTKVVAISIMNKNTSGNPPHGTNIFDSNTFSYWQYIDQMVYWGGSAGEGLIIPPSPDVTNAAHKNGVQVLGTIFFPPVEFAGQIEWLDDFLSQDEKGHFPMIDKLIEVASHYGFDGWFINQETQGTEEKPLTKEHADLMIEFITAFKAQSKDTLEIMYYDAMTVDGDVVWQNALNDKNSDFIAKNDDNLLSDSMFLNFWWTSDSLAHKNLLKFSHDHAVQRGVNPYQLFAGVDVQAKGFDTPIRWDLFESSSNETYTSLGLYAADWAYSSSNSLDEYLTNENLFWVNSQQDPRKIIDASETSWPGVSHYITERSAITSLPFVSNFNLGNGFSFFIDGEKVSSAEWNNRGVSDILPTYRWIIDNGGNNRLDASIDYDDAFYGGNSLKLHGSMSANTKSSITLYKTVLPISDNLTFTTTARASNETALQLVVTLDDGTKETVKADNTIKDDWTTVSYDLTAFEGQSIQTIAYELESNIQAKEYELNFGNITINDQKTLPTSTVTNVNIEDAVFDDDVLLAGVRITWEVEGNAHHYEVYRVNEDNSKSFLGVSKSTTYFANMLTRAKDTNQTTFKIIPVNPLLERGKGASVMMVWPD